MGYFTIPKPTSWQIPSFCHLILSLQEQFNIMEFHNSIFFWGCTFNDIFMGISISPNYKKVCWIGNREWCCCHHNHYGIGMNPCFKFLLCCGAMLLCWCCCCCCCLYCSHVFNGGGGIGSGGLVARATRPRLPLPEPGPPDAQGHPAQLVHNLIHRSHDIAGQLRGLKYLRSVLVSFLVIWNII